MSSDNLPIQINFDCNPTLPNILSNRIIDWSFYNKTIQESLHGNVNCTNDIEETATNLINQLKILLKIQNFALNNEIIMPSL